MTVHGTREMRRRSLLRGVAGMVGTLIAADMQPGPVFETSLVAASIAGQQVFPPDNPWNTDVFGYSVDPNSDTLIASIGLNTGLHPDFGTVYNGAPNGIPYVVVPANQPLVPITFTEFGDQSDPGPYPIPPDAPIEGAPNPGGDQHVLVVDPSHAKLYEIYHAAPNADGSWNAGSGAIFDLNSNALRPAGWTSADAAGLPIFPGLVRYDEVVQQGAINHALRFTVANTRRAYVYPARHYASSSDDSSLPPMGMRVRLKASFDISGFTANMRVILQAMKTYGMFVADNGSNWYVSGAPHPNWSDDELVSQFRLVTGMNFEVVGAPPGPPPVPSLPAARGGGVLPGNPAPLPTGARTITGAAASPAGVAPMPLPRR